MHKDGNHKDWNLDLSTGQWLTHWFANMGGCIGIGGTKFGGWLNQKQAIEACKELASLQDECLKQFD